MCSAEEHVTPPRIPEPPPIPAPPIPDMNGWTREAKKKVLKAFMFMNYVLDEGDDYSHFVSGRHQAQMDEMQAEMDDFILLVTCSGVLCVGGQPWPHVL